MRVECESPLAHRYFDQGLRWIVAYNFKMALANFVQAQIIDGQCALCAWGEVLCRGQNLNEFPVESEDNLRKAHEALERARRVVHNTKEKDLIEALAIRQQPRQAIRAEERVTLNGRYADAMSALAQKYPDDTWVVLFACDALLNTSPWDYWTERGRVLKPRMQRVGEWLKRILAADPHNVMALHFTIHLYEAGADPHLAVEASKQLEGLVPGSEHLLHMPSHGYMRGGLYQRAAEVNLVAFRDVALEDHAYPQHNLEFVVRCEMILGNKQSAIDAAQRVAEISESLLATGADGYEAIFPYERFVVAPLYVGVLFGRWDWIAEQRTLPAPKRVYHRAFWHWAHAHHLIATGGAPATVDLHVRGLEEARVEMETEENVRRYSATLYPARQLIQILKHLTDAAYFKQVEHSLDHLDSLRSAWAIECAMFYDEPPSQWFSTGVILGENLLDAHLFKEAHDVYQSTLAAFPNHPWALFGLARACEALGLSCRDDAALGYGKIWKGGKNAPVQHFVECWRGA